MLIKIIKENDRKIQAKIEEIKKKKLLHLKVLSILWLMCYIGARFLEKILAEENEKKCSWPKCKKCGTKLESSGSINRKLQTLLGEINWKRKVGRCPNRCKKEKNEEIVAPLDKEIGLKPRQRISTELKYFSCLLAVFTTFATSSDIIKKLFNISISAKTIWNWCQEFGAKAIERTENELLLFKTRKSLVQKELIDEETLAMPMIFGGDGVNVAFRPQEKTPKGKTVCKQVKVGIISRIKSCLSKDGEEVNRLFRRRLVATLNTDDFKDLLELELHKQHVTATKTVAWISDGAKSLWNLYSDFFASFAIGILDFYHAAQYIWRFAKIYLDGRTKKAKKWFDDARHSLKEGDIVSIGCSVDSEHIFENYAEGSELRKYHDNLMAYLLRHNEHVDYNHFKELKLPIGSGLVESACKWLIAQRFKGPGMRWSESGFNNLLALRLAWVNERFDSLFF